MTRRLYLWWRAAVALAATPTTPRIAPAASDRAFAAELRHSRLLTLCHAASTMTRAAWPDARVNRWSQRVRAQFAALPAAERVRHVAGAIAAAGLTALVLRVAGPSWVAPFTWVLPLAFALVGAVGVIAAEPLARAISAKFS
jgi:predicted alpha/beta hydrolase family esterase